MKMLPLTISTLIVSVGAVCSPSNDIQKWPFSAEPGSSWFSCASTAGGTNDLGNVPTQCENDPASVFIQMQKGEAECLVASSYNCKIPMHDFVSMDYDFYIDSCLGVWAAPLWMTPDTWQWGAGSGEIDSLEFCARDAIHLNFAGGGHQVELDPTQYSIDDSNGHITVRKDDEGIVTITACTLQEATDNKGQCVSPVYSDCNECQWGTNNTYACWCNPDADNIYGSGGCAEGTDCEWTLVSDLWNGVTGDSGYYGCMTAVPEIGLEAATPNLNSTCSFSVENIIIRGGGPNESLQWGSGSPSSCSVLTPDPAN